jgi:preprotein translocase subunit SecD
MRRQVCLLVALFFLGSSASVWPQDKPPPARKLPDGVYAVERESLKEKELLPLKDGEVLVVNRYRYLKKDESEPPRFLVVRAAPDVPLDLVGEPKSVKDGEEVVRILLKLQPKAATALERLTAARLGRPITIILDGEVVTMHKIREVIKGGEVQITSCAPGAAKHLLERLEAQQKRKSP